MRGGPNIEASEGVVDVVEVTCCPTSLWEECELEFAVLVVAGCNILCV